MLSNRINQFGTRQRCLNADCSLAELLLIALHYERDRNFYIYENDYHFVGTLNRKSILAQNISPDKCSSITVGEVCRNAETAGKTDVVYDTGAPLGDFLLDAFYKKFPYSDELAMVDGKTGRLTAIFRRREFFNELYTVISEDETEMICYREPSRYYKPQEENFNRHARNINSQHGEDGILAALFDCIGTTSKYAVEFGGWDGIFLSNIRPLITNRGFSGLFIEGEEERARNLLKNYEGNPNVDCMAAFVGFRGEYTLDNILKIKGAPQQIDLISIDIDGYDYHVWDALKNYRPRVVLIEYNPSIQNDVVVINPYNESIFCGSSAAALVELGRKKGYALVAATETNLIFVVEEEFDKVQIWDNDLSVLRAETKLSDGRFFQTYNKQINLTGFTNFIWEGSPFGPETQFTFRMI